MEGALSVVIMTDPFWYNRLLLELDYDADDVNDGEAEIQFHELLLALTRMRYGNSCLPFELEIRAEQRLTQQHELNALKLMGVYVGAWKMMKYPPAHIKTEADLRRYKAAVNVARLWAIGTVIRHTRLSRHQSWHAHDVTAVQRDHGRFAEFTKLIVDFHSETMDLETGQFPSAEVRFPSDLSEPERKHVHTIAEEYHLQHGSAGEESEGSRYIRVWRNGTAPPDGSKSRSKSRSRSRGGEDGDS